MRPLRSASIRSGSFTTGPREVLTRTADGFILVNQLASTIPLVCLFNRTWSDRMSDSSSSASRETSVTPVPATVSGAM